MYLFLRYMYVSHTATALYNNKELFFISPIINNSGNNTEVYLDLPHRQYS